MTHRYSQSRLVALFAVILLAPLISAQTSEKKITVHLDPALTQIHWTLGDVLHTVHGTFALKSGIVVFDPKTGAANGEMLVDLDTGASGDDIRDGRMKRNILETATYPQAIFHPEKVSGTLRAGAAQTMTVDGTFTIHGKDHPLRLVVSAQMSGPGQITATTHFSVPYVAWGMKDPSTFVLRVGKRVDVDVTATGTVDGLP
ncbi:MAG TPA: YceI family protein [Acidobacteriaceae bacterium]|jgi:polyisoprenoid-binding protein YceI|nr:YceI family protein [Acidobacteriaceae bacterium]